MCAASAGVRYLVVHLGAIETQGKSQMFESERRLRRLFDSGERSAEAVVEKASRVILEHPETRIDYVKVADAVTCRPLTGEIDRDSVLALAVFVDKARLIDNVALHMPAD